jgi:hypothetical protein
MGKSVRVAAYVTRSSNASERREREAKRYGVPGVSWEERANSLEALPSICKTRMSLNVTAFFLSPYQDRVCLLITDPIDNLQNSQNLPLLFSSKQSYFY